MSKRWDDRWFDPVENPEELEMPRAITDVLLAVAADWEADAKRAADPGRYKHYDASLASDEWRAVRKLALARAGHRCRACGSRRRLHVHHDTYERLGREHVEDLTVLCQYCHARRHAELEVAKR